MLSSFNATEEFKAGDGNKYKICSYILNNEYLGQHYEIVTQPNAGMIEYRQRDNDGLDGILQWVDEATSAENTHLLGIYDERTSRLIGTSKVTINHEFDSFSAGILISQDVMGNANLGRYVKGYILNRCFLSLGFGRCDGGCLKGNIPSISVYKYFRFSASTDGDTHLGFTLTREAFIANVAKILRMELVEAGFDVLGLDDAALIESEIVSLRGYSSLSFMSFAAKLMECKEDLEILEIFDCERIKEIALVMGASLFALDQR